jgi:hypothetical protein
MKETQMNRNPFRVITLDAGTGQVRPEFSGNGVYMPDEEAQVGRRIIIANEGDFHKVHARPIVVARIPASSIGHIGPFDPQNREHDLKEDLLLCVIR